MQNLEIEFKNILTKGEYLLLLHEFKQDENKAVPQENHYFDTPAFALKELGTALRIRKKKNSFEMTLKQPAQVGLLETNQTLTKVEVEEALKTGRLPGGIIQEIVEKSGIFFSDIEYFGSLITKRIEIEYQEGLLVLDHSFYLSKEDFEMEYEVKDFHDGQKKFNELLEKCGIPRRETLNKIRRFYQQKYHQLL